MITLKNCISNLNFNYILFGFIFISFFYIKNLINKLTDLHRLNIIILKKLYNKIKSISKKNKKNHHKLNKKFKKIKKIIKNISNNESNKIIKVIPTAPTTPTTLINNIEQNQSNCITIDVENEFEFVD